MSAVYNCPTCGTAMERDLVLFTKHTDEHIVDELRKMHPAWITPDGFCQACLEYYKAARRGESLPFNIAGPQITRRWSLMAISIVILFLSGAYLFRSNAPRFARALLFIPLFAVFFTYFQAKGKTCVILGFKGTQNMGDGEEPLKNETQKASLKNQSTRILTWSVLTAAALTSLLVLC